MARPQAGLSARSPEHQLDLALKVPALLGALSHSIDSGACAMLSTPRSCQGPSCVSHNISNSCNVCLCYVQPIFERGHHEDVTEGEEILSLNQLLGYVHNANASRKSQLQAAYANLWAAKHLCYRSEVSQVQTCSTEEECPGTCLSRPPTLSVGHLCYASVLLYIAG